VRGCVEEDLNVSLCGWMLRRDEEGVFLVLHGVRVHILGREHAGSERVGNVGMRSRDTFLAGRMLSLAGWRRRR
jgi:hypothetical protein